MKYTVAKLTAFTGVASAKAQAGLAGLGIQLTEKALPGPLLSSSSSPLQQIAAIQT